MLESCPSDRARPRVYRIGSRTEVSSIHRPARGIICSVSILEGGYRRGPIDVIREGGDGGCLCGGILGCRGAEQHRGDICVVVSLGVVDVEHLVSVEARGGGGGDIVPVALIPAVDSDIR